MSTNTLILWLFLIFAYSAGVYWYRRENRQLSRQWFSSLNEEFAGWLTTLIWQRTYQLLAVLFVFFLALSVYDWQVSRLRNDAEQLLRANGEQQKQLDTLTSELQLASERELQLKAELEKAQSAAQVVLGTSPYYPPAAQNGIESLYGSGASLGDQAALDRLKKHYEELLVNNLFLKKCGIAKPTDVHVIISALSQEMASVNAPGRLQYDIVTSARGSYKEMYENSPCDAPQTTALAAQYRKYVDTVSQQLGNN